MLEVLHPATGGLELLLGDVELLGDISSAGTDERVGERDVLLPALLEHAEKTFLEGWEFGWAREEDVEFG